jgi:ribonuclease HII
VADSKLLSPAAREALLPALARWGLARAVGHAEPAEIDAVGIIGALRLAGTRAMAAVEEQLGPVDTVLLDGSYDWLTAPADLFTALGDPAVPTQGAPVERRVHLRVKADRTCASVAAASVIAKCTRDALMVGLAAGHPQYGWEQNKGYASPEHLAALARHGTCALHRRSWNLPGLVADRSDSWGMMDA